MKHFPSKGTGVLWSRAASVALAGLIAFSGTPAVALAGYAEKPIVAQSELPAKFDLRTKGLVTPVKNQAPFGSCWAFGGISASETSILSKMGKTYSEYPIDLSEKHLAWFANVPVTEAEEPSQVGEGLYRIDEDDSVYNMGGFNVNISTLFSAGTGPVAEEHFPYQGANGLLESEYYRQNYDAFVDYLTDTYIERGLDEAAAKAKAIEVVDEAIVGLETQGNYYAGEDDWTIPEKTKSGAANRNIYDGFILRDGNILADPGLRDENKKWLGINEEGILAMKRELFSGNGIEIDYAADTSIPGEVENGYSMNLDTWAQYSFEETNPNHAVCIVGWDDTYPASNFTHRVFVTDDDGNATEDPERSKLTTPPGNGAWIVKNSWGSQTNAVKDGLTDAEGNKYPANYSDWGVRNSKGQATGYFYLSYYDKTIFDPETYEFDLDFDDHEAFYANEYDYLPGDVGFWCLKSKNTVATANEFVAEAEQKLVSVSTRTGDANSTVDFKVYKLAKNQVKPEEGELVAEFSKTFDYAGYHRVDLPTPVVLDEGQRFSVVSFAYATDEAGQRTYSAVAAASIGKEDAEELESKTYGVAVVNHHESFLKVGDNWVDWQTYQGGDAFKKIALTQLDEDTSIIPVVDNFAIKAFSQLV